VDRAGIVLTDRYAQAVAYAGAVHVAQTRKGTRIPYVAHLLGVSSLVLEAGGDEDLAIAGLLHDAAEDHGGAARLADIRVLFGERVASVVDECSDSLADDGAPKSAWETRKRDHLARLRTASDDTLVVWAADKVHNGRAIVTDLVDLGPEAMRRFHAAPDRVLWYYEQNLALIEERAARAALLVPLRQVLQQLRVLISTA
jgi:(p)ppGpp synthase/HD superfamily hydrolase